MGASSSLSGEARLHFQLSSAGRTTPKVTVNQNSHITQYSRAPLRSCSSMSSATTQLSATIGSGSFTNYRTNDGSELVRNWHSPVGASRGLVRPRAHSFTIQTTMSISITLFVSLTGTTRVAVPSELDSSNVDILCNRVDQAIPRIHVPFLAFPSTLQLQCSPWPRQPRDAPWGSPRRPPAPP